MDAKFLKLTELDSNEEYRIESLRGKLVEPATLKNTNGVIGLRSDGSMFFRQEGKIYPFTIDDKYVDARVRNLFKRSFIDLAVPVPMNGGTPFDIYLYVVFFAGLKYFEDMNLIFSNNAIQRLKKMHLIKDDEHIEAALNRFLDISFYLQNSNVSGDSESDQLLIAYADSSAWMNSAYDDDRKARSEQKKDTGKQESQIEPSSDVGIEKNIALQNISVLHKRPQRILELYGKDMHDKDIILQIGLYLDEEQHLLSVVQRVIGGRRGKKPCLRLGHCRLSATTELKYSSDAVRMAMQSDDNTYVNLWKLYSQKEGDFLLRRIRQIGLIGYQDIKVDVIDGKSQLIVTTKKGSRHSLRLLQKGDRLRTVEVLPAYLNNVEMNWQQYFEYVMEHRAEIKGDSTKNKNVYEITAIRDDSLILQPLEDSEMKLSGYLILDDTGDKKQILRRKNARDKIEHGQSANPHLGYIIGGSSDDFSENMGVLPSGWKSHSKHIAALSDAVVKKIFRYPPTQTQREAIDIALNTPDIAIIQGPPGTGKTTVITAILERLNELADKREIQRGQVLVTSLQHDAVRNIIERVSINSLPTVKFGKRQSDEEDIDTMVNHWCDNLAKRLQEKNPQLVDSQQADELSYAFEIYECNPTVQNAYDYLTKALNLELSDQVLIADLQDKKNTLERKVHPEVEDELVRAIRRLRTQKDSFIDGGADAADTLLLQVEKLLDPKKAEDRNLLETLEAAADCFDSRPDSILLKRLALCKRTLLSRCIPKPRYTKPTVDPDIISLYQRQMQELEKNRTDSDRVLNRLLQTLENDPESIRETLKNYSFAYAATAQQSMGYEIREAKGALDKNKDPEYDTVIIDEAARVNPGDLMIPLSQAQRRIIMVGDHRQLPHMYDEEIFEELNKEGMTVQAENIRESMFEHLLNRAKALTHNDGIPRFVTLDNQFRMHPALGNFISENFYARYGEGFKSPLGGEKFPQPFEKQPMKWVDIPLSFGPMEKNSYSKFRSCEAEYIVESIRRYKAKMKGKPLSMGVISFYRAQVNQIRHRLREEGLLDDVNVGTVDSFQGMEFDVIFLSVVRTGITVKPAEITALDKDPETIEDSQIREEFIRQKDSVGRKQYGFLTSENRLCVALSRQKCLLVVVGDGSLFHGNPGGKLAQIFVPALKNFYELCEEKGMVEHA